MVPMVPVVSVVSMVPMMGPWHVYLRLVEAPTKKSESD